MDPLADLKTCERDASLLTGLGVNVLQVSYYDSTQSHAPCLDAFAAAGIYIFVRLDLGSYFENHDGIRWSERVFSRLSGAIDSLANHTNVLALSVGRYPNNQPLPSIHIIRAAIRDLKRHVRDKGLREMPIGYTASPYSAIRKDVALENQFRNVLDLMGCSETRADFVALAMGPEVKNNCTSTETIDFLARVVASSSIPVFATDTGCMLNKNLTSAISNSFDDRQYGYISRIFSAEIALAFNGVVVREFYYTNLTDTGWFGSCFMPPTAMMKF